MEELEIEKRFLIPQTRIEELKKSITTGSGVYMNDFYVPNGDSHKDLRLRQKDNEYMVTRKRPIREDDLTTMVETTIELSRQEYEALSSGITSNIEKKRYKVNISGWEGELDIFEGRHTGLAVVEFEFQNKADLANFEKESKLTFPDITNMEWLASGRLAETDAESLQDKLKEFY